MGAGKLLLLKSHLFYRIRAWFVVCFCEIFPKKTGRHELFQNHFPGNEGRPHVGRAESQRFVRRRVSKRRALVGFQQRRVAIKIWPVKYGRKWRWVGYPSFTDLSFAEKCHLLNSSKNVGPAVVLLGGFLGALGTVG